MTETHQTPRAIAATLRQPESAAFQQAATQGQFSIPRCQHCGQTHWYPRALCPFCFSPDIQWESATGLGTIYSYTVMRRAKPAYAIAYVQLEEGPIMMTNIVQCHFDELHIGMPVKVGFELAANDTWVPVFSPAP